MPHCDPETLALRALGEPVPAEDAAHLASCDTCRADLDALVAVITQAREVTAEDVPTAPPDHVWDAIADELHLTAATPSRDHAEMHPRPAEPAATEGPSRHDHGGQWGNRRGLYLVGAAAAVVGLVVGALGVVLAGRTSSGQVVASTSLEPVGTSAAHGTATLREAGGGRTLDVDLRDLPPGEGYFEVWFMNADTGGSISLGALDPGQETTFEVPAGLVVTNFPYVDISLEPLDGDPAHSSDSVARGRLAPA